MEGITQDPFREHRLDAPARASLKSRLKRKLDKIDGEWRFHERPDLSALVNWSSGKNAPFHRWFRYREAYSPELVQALNLGDRILDPFCGCGSALVGAAQRNKSSFGIDLNPLATFVAQVKLHPLSLSELSDVEHFASSLSALDLDTDVCNLIPDTQIAHKVFEPRILTCILNLKRHIHGYPSSAATRNFLLLAWIGILEKVGSYFKEGNGIKYRNALRRPGKYIRRQEGWQLQRFGSDQKSYVLSSYLEHVRNMLLDAGAWTTMLGRGEVSNGNALELSTLVPGKFDSIVFSPPYANRFDYFESMKVELWFGGFVESQADLQSLRKSSLRSHLGADMKRESVVLPELEALISDMDRQSSSWRMGVPELLRGYFSDMVEVLRQCREKLTDNGICHVVVGNSAFAGVIIPSDSLTARAAELAGFGETEIWVTRHLTVAPQQRTALAGFEHFMRESIVVLRP